jgi:uncharacterized protein YndB with AHSA1/START domain
MPKLIDEEISCATLVRATPEKVYDAIATAEGLDGWFTSGARVHARAGGEIHFSWKDWGADRITHEETGRVLEANRPKRFAFQWFPDHPSYATTVEINFEPREEGTIIRLREYGYHDTPSGRKSLIGCATGWGEALTLWKFYVEHGIRY